MRIQRSPLFKAFGAGLQRCVSALRKCFNRTVTPTQLEPACSGKSSGKKRPVITRLYDEDTPPPLPPRTRTHAHARIRTRTDLDAIKPEPSDRRVQQARLELTSNFSPYSPSIADQLTDIKLYPEVRENTFKNPQVLLDLNQNPIQFKIVGDDTPKSIRCFESHGDKLYYLGENRKYQEVKISNPHKDSDKLAETSLRYNVEYQYFYTLAPLDKEENESDRRIVRPTIAPDNAYQDAITEQQDRLKTLFNELKASKEQAEAGAVPSYADKRTPIASLVSQLNKVHSAPKLQVSSSTFASYDKGDPNQLHDVKLYPKSIKKLKVPKKLLDLNQNPVVFKLNEEETPKTLCCHEKEGDKVFYMENNKPQYIMIPDPNVSVGPDQGEAMLMYDLERQYFYTLLPYSEADNENDRIQVYPSIDKSENYQKGIDRQTIKLQKKQKQIRQEKEEADRLAKEKALRKANGQTEQSLDPESIKKVTFKSRVKKFFKRVFGKSVKPKIKPAPEEDFIKL